MASLDHSNILNWPVKGLICARPTSDSGWETAIYCMASAPLECPMKQYHKVGPWINHLNHYHPHDVKDAQYVCGLAPNGSNQGVTPVVRSGNGGSAQPIVNQTILPSGSVPPPARYQAPAAYTAPSSGPGNGAPVQPFNQTTMPYNISSHQNPPMSPSNGVVPLTLNRAAIPPPPSSNAAFGGSQPSFTQGQYVPQGQSMSPSVGTSTARTSGPPVAPTNTGFASQLRVSPNPPAFGGYTGAPLFNRF
ncbi:hypothetical protein F5Y10DRAFT_268947 [Nemania abortiva]|nr:hypothetical protein F5Y10DRAFT_268947 [Nemania abortiva]